MLENQSQLKNQFKVFHEDDKRRRRKVFGRGVAIPTFYPIMIFPSFFFFRKKNDGMMAFEDSAFLLIAEFYGGEEGIFILSNNIVDVEKMYLYFQFFPFSFTSE